MKVELGVHCTSSLFPVSVRLLGGDTANEGRVQLTVDNTTGGICDSGWNENAAKVTCRMLGFKGSFYALPFSYEMLGSRVQSLLGSVTCNGSETSLQQCTYSKDGQCRFFAGLVCSNEGVFEYMIFVNKVFPIMNSVWRRDTVTQSIARTKIYNI